MIADVYKDQSCKVVTKSDRDRVQMTADEVKLSIRNSDGWEVIFDKTPTTVRMTA